MRPFLAIGAALERERGHLFPWVPVCLGPWHRRLFHSDIRAAACALCLSGVCALAAGLARYLAEALRPLGIALVLVLAGVAVAGLRAHQVAGPQSDISLLRAGRGTDPGDRPVAVRQSAPDPRPVVLGRVSPARTPRRVRISLHGPQGYLMPEPGLTVILTGHLSPPQGPVEPGGFDFQRKAWFDQLGAVGYTRHPRWRWRAAEEGAPVCWFTGSGWRYRRRFRRDPGRERGLCGRDHYRRPLGHGPGNGAGSAPLEPWRIFWRSRAFIWGF